MDWILRLDVTKKLQDPPVSYRDHFLFQVEVKLSHIARYKEITTIFHLWKFWLLDSVKFQLLSVENASQQKGQEVQLVSQPIYSLAITIDTHSSPPKQSDTE